MATDLIKIGQLPPFPHVETEDIDTRMKRDDTWIQGNYLISGRLHEDCGSQGYIFFCYVSYHELIQENIITYNNLIQLFLVPMLCPRRRVHGDWVQSWARHHWWHRPWDIATKAVAMARDSSSCSLILDDIVRDDTWRFLMMWHFELKWPLDIVCPHEARRREQSAEAGKSLCVNMFQLTLGSMAISGS